MSLDLEQDAPPAGRIELGSVATPKPGRIELGSVAKPGRIELSSGPKPSSPSLGSPAEDPFKDIRDPAGAAPDIAPQFERSYKTVFHGADAAAHANAVASERARLGRDLTPVEQNRIHQRISLASANPTPREYLESKAVQADPGNHPARAAAQEFKSIGPRVLGIVSPESAALVQHEQAVEHPVAPTTVNQIGGMVGGAGRVMGEFMTLGPAGAAAAEGTSAAGEGRLEVRRAREQGTPISGKQEAAYATGKGAIGAAATAAGGEAFGGTSGGVVNRVATNVGVNAAASGLSKTGENIVARETGVDPNRPPLQNVPTATAIGAGQGLVLGAGAEGFRAGKARFLPSPPAGRIELGTLSPARDLQGMADRVAQQQPAVHPEIQDWRATEGYQQAQQQRFVDESRANLVDRPQPKNIPPSAIDPGTVLGAPRRLPVLPEGVPPEPERLPRIPNRTEPPSRGPIAQAAESPRAKDVERVKAKVMRGEKLTPEEQQVAAQQQQQFNRVRSASVDEAVRMNDTDFGNWATGKQGQYKNGDLQAARDASEAMGRRGNRVAQRQIENDLADRLIPEDAITQMDDPAQQQRARDRNEQISSLLRELEQNANPHTAAEERPAAVVSESARPTATLKGQKLTAHEQLVGIDHMKSMLIQHLKDRYQRYLDDAGDLSPKARRVRAEVEADAPLSRLAISDVESMSGREVLQQYRALNNLDISTGNPLRFGDNDVTVPSERPVPTGTAYNETGAPRSLRDEVLAGLENREILSLPNPSQNAEPNPPPAKGTARGGKMQGGASGGEKPKALIGSAKLKGLQDQLRDQVVEHFGRSISDVPYTHPLAMQASRGEVSPGKLISYETADRLARDLPADHPAKITLHNIEELQKNPRGTKVQAFNTNDVPDGSRIVVNDKEVLTVDREEGVVKDGITAPIPEGGMNLYGKKMLPPETFEKGTDDFFSGLEVHQALQESGVEPERAAESVKKLIAYHGSPHDFEKFDISKIGTGEGAQAYGHGLYFASAREVGEHYKKSLTSNTDAAKARLSLDGKEVPIPWKELRGSFMTDGPTAEALHTLQNHDGDFAAAEQSLRSLNHKPTMERNIAALERLRGHVKVIEPAKRGHLYQTELAPREDELLDWDKPLSEQSETVKKALEPFIEDAATTTPDERFLRFGGHISDGKRASGADVYHALTYQSAHSPVSFEEFRAARPQLDEATARNAYEQVKRNESRDTANYGKTPEKRAAEALRSLGIRGIKYLDQSSRAAGEGSRNYVIFDDKDVTITHKNDVPVTPKETPHAAPEGNNPPSLHGERAPAEESRPSGAGGAANRPEPAPQERGTQAAKEVAPTSDTGVFGQTIYRPATGKQQAGLFHEPVKVEGPQPEQIKASANAVNPENTGKLFGQKLPRERFNELMRQRLKGESGADPSSPVYRNASSAAFEQVKREFPHVKSYFDLDTPAPPAGNARERGMAALPDLGPVTKAISAASKKVKDFLSLEAAPKLSREGLGEEASAHAGARHAVPFMVADKLAKVFDQGDYQKPDVMKKTTRAIRDDNVLGGFDEFRQRARDAQQEAANQKQLYKTLAQQRKTATGAQKRDLTIKMGQALEAMQKANRLMRRSNASAAEIAKSHDIASLDLSVQNAMNDPAVMRHVENWKKFIEPEANQWYSVLKGMDPNAQQETRGRHLGARMNLLGVDAEGKPLNKFLEAGDESKPIVAGTGNLKAPDVKRDPFNRAASFTGTYSDDPALVLTNSIARRWNEVTKLNLLKGIEDKGVGVLGPGRSTKMKGFVAPTEIGGKSVRMLPVTLPRQTKGGGVEMEHRPLYIRSDLYGEVRGALATDMQLDTHPVAKWLTAAQMASGVDAVAHTFNQWRLAANTMGEGPVADVLKKIPGVGASKGAYDMVKTITDVIHDSPEVRADLNEMARKGYIRPEFPASGFQKITGVQHFIHRNDTAIRLLLLRHWRNLVSEGVAPKGLRAERDFVNQLGQYNARLMGPLARVARSSGLSPFVVAGRNFNRQAVRYLTGSPGFSAPTWGGAVRARLTQLALPLAVAATPALVNMITVGKAGGRPGVPIGAIDTGKDDEKGNPIVIDVAQFTGVRRGMRALGINALIEGIRQGKDANQIAGNMADEMAQTQLHPFLGPAASFVTKGLTGRQLDLRGTMEANTIPGGGIAQNVENLRAAAESQNPMFYAAGKTLKDATGAALGNEKKQAALGEDLKSFVSGAGGKAALSSLGVKSVKPGKDAAEELATRLASLRYSNRGPTPEEEERIKQNAPLLQQLRTDPVAGKKAMEDAIGNGTLSEREASLLEKKAGMTPLQWSVRQLSADEAAQVYQKASAQQREQLKDLMSGKIKRSDLSPQEQDKLYADLKIDRPVDLDLRRELSALNKKKRDAQAKGQPFRGPDALRLRQLSAISEGISQIEAARKKGRIKDALADQRIKVLLSRATRRAA